MIYAKVAGEKFRNNSLIHKNDGLFYTFIDC